MDVQDLPIWLIFFGTTLVIVLSIEFGYRVGSTAHRKSEDEKESPVSAIAGSVLALLAFMLAFTFSLASDRYDARKSLVRDQAVSIRTAYARADFLPEPDREESQSLIREYVDILVEIGNADSLADAPAFVDQSLVIHDRLWAIAVRNVNTGWTSEIASSYTESLTDMSNVQALRVAISLQARMPAGVWGVLFVLLILGMFAVGYQTAIAASRRSWAMLVLALSFSVVIGLVAALDNPKSGFLHASQQPIADVQTWIDHEAQRSASISD